MNFKSIFLMILMLTASPIFAAGTVGLQVEAGSFRTSGNNDYAFDTEHYGSVIGKIEGEAESLALRGVYRQANGLEFGIGARTGDANYSAAMGSQATTDYSHNVAEATARQSAIDALDKSLPDYESQKSALEAEMNAFSAAADRIVNEHNTSTNQVGGSVTAMKYQHTKYGGDVGIGTEVFVGHDTVPALKLAYRTPISSGQPNFGVNAVFGDKWAGANLSLDF